MLAYFILLLTMVSCQSVYSKVTAPPTSFPLASEGLVQIDGTLQGSNCAKDPIFIQGPLSAKGTALYSGLVYLKGGNSDQIVLALSTDGLNFDTPIELDGVESEWRSVAAIIFEGVVHVAWDSSNPSGNIMYSQFDGVSGTPMFTPYPIPGIYDAKYAVAFAITRKPSPALSVFWSATSESKPFISFVTYDSTTSSWSSASHINTDDWSIATIALAATPNFTVLAWTGESENFYALQTYDTWTGFTDGAGTALEPNTDYNRPALVAWPIANNQDANFLIFTSLDGNLYYQYHKADGSWDGNAYGQITSNGSPVPATSAPTAGLIGAGPKPRLFIYYCQRVLPTIYRMAYGIVAPN